MHHLFQTKKLLRDLRQSDFHSSSAQGWGDDGSAETHFPGDLCISLSCRRIPALAVLSGCHAQKGKAGKVFHHPFLDPSAKKEELVLHSWGRKKCSGHSQGQNSQIFHNTKQSIRISCKNTHACRVKILG